MPNAFDPHTSKADFDPLANLLAFDISKIPLNITALLDQWKAAIDEFIIPIFKELTGIDLSSPEAFFISLYQIIVGGGQAVLSFIQAIIQPVIDLIVNGLTGGFHLGNPMEMVTGLLQGVANIASTAVQSANQAADVARQLMQYVVQVVQNSPVGIIFNDIFDAINGFAFWVLSWFGITRQSVSDNNPAVAGALGRIAALESQGTPGLEGYADHFNRQVLGTDWANISGLAPLAIVDGAYVKSWSKKASRYAAKTLVTDTWHVQASIAGLENGKASMFASCAPATSDGGFGGAISLELEHVTYPFNQGGVDYLRLYSINGGLGSGTLRRTATFDTGNIKNGDVLAIEYWSSNNTFYVFRNNEEITGLRWTDSGNVVQHGLGHRDVVLMTGIIDNGGYPGNGWDDLSVYDIKVA